MRARLASASTASTRFTPESVAAAAATAAMPLPKTTTSMLRAGECRRAAHALGGGVEGSRAVFGDDEYARHQISPLAAELRNQFVDILHHDAFLAHGGRCVVHGLHARARRDAERGRCDDLQRLLLGLDDVGQLHEARFIEPQVGGDHRGQVDLQGFKAGVHLARDARGAAADLNLRGEGGLRPIPQAGEHLAGLVVVVVDGLLAQQHQQRLLAFHQLQQDARRVQRFDARGFHQQRAIGAHGQRRAQLVLDIGRPDGGHHDLIGQALFLEPQGLFEGDFVERIDALLDAVRDDTCVIRFYANSNVVIDDALYAYENAFHAGKCDPIPGREYTRFWLRGPCRG